VFSHPILSKGPQTGQRLAVSGSVGGGFAGDDVVGVADGETLDLDPTLPGVFKALNAVRCEYEV